MSLQPARAPRLAQQGLTIIELMVSLLVGMILSLAVFGVLTVSEGRKRTTTSVNDANLSGAYALSLLDPMIRAAGSGLKVIPDETMGCTLKTARGAQQLLPVVDDFALPAPFDEVNPNPDAAGEFKLAPVLILPGQTTPGVSGQTSDALLIMRGASARGGDAPIPLTASATATALPTLNSVGIQGGDIVLVVNRLLANRPCLLQQVKADHVSGATPINTSEGSYTQSTVDSTEITSFPTGSWVVNLGNRPQFNLIGVGDNNTLFSYDLLNLDGAAAPTAVELADGVFELKALYGIGTDTDGDGTFDTTEWVAPDDERFDLEAMNADASLIGRITAIRLGLILRTALPEKDAVTAGPVVLFPDLTNAAGTALTYTRNLSDAEKVYRYRTLETTIPVRNNLL